ncbi:MAG: hypothetical protein DME27_01455 [Verrucomicrobia bacterium]|nr:MAG: hypothetical protein DME27_01455 [Verrucomicrobiota bacterium]
MQQSPGAANAQIAIGCDQFRETFGGEPVGFWLPECAYSASIAKSLQAENIRWFVVDAHAFEQAVSPARRGTFAPCFTRAGPAAFARDIQASRQVWSAQLGYPGDPTYRDFYRDIGFDLSANELAPLPGNGFTGIKYHRVTGRDVSRARGRNGPPARPSFYREMRRRTSKSASRSLESNHDSAVRCRTFRTLVV